MQASMEESISSANTRITYMDDCQKRRIDDLMVDFRALDEYAHRKSGTDDRCSMRIENLREVMHDELKRLD